MILSGVLGLFTLQWGLNRVSGKRDQAFPVMDPYCCPWVPRCGGFGRQGVSEKTDAWTTPSLVLQNMEAKSRLCNLDADRSRSGPGLSLYVSPLASFPFSHANLPTHSLLPGQSRNSQRRVILFLFTCCSHGCHKFSPSLARQSSACGISSKEHLNPHVCCVCPLWAAAAPLDTPLLSHKALVTLHGCGHFNGLSSCIFSRLLRAGHLSSFCYPSTRSRS